MLQSKKYASFTDEKLVELCNSAGGSVAKNAFDTLYCRHKEYVVRVAWQFSKDNNIALDALQETFVYLLRQFPPTGNGLSLSAKLTTYLYPIAKKFSHFTDSQSRA